VKGGKKDREKKKREIRLGGSFAPKRWKKDKRRDHNNNTLLGGKRGRIIEGLRQGRSSAYYGGGRYPKKKTERP